MDALKSHPYTSVWVSLCLFGGSGGSIIAMMHNPFWS